MRFVALVAELRFRVGFCLVVAFVGYVCGLWLISLLLWFVWYFNSVGITVLWCLVCWVFRFDVCCDYWFVLGAVELFVLLRWL